ncbi:MAG: hypothetical protein H0V80_13470 [Acidobacteria bacterium]|nr:hypothetical protein [Acidobacteriota bacterium]
MTYRLPLPLLLAAAWILGGIAVPVHAALPENKVVIRERAGVTTSNYPVQIGRPFVQGEIREFPEALVGGTAVRTQADVKQRWPDGSVRHAILSFLLPRLGSGETLTVTFRNQSSGNNTGFLSVNGMLGTPFGFDATMRLTGRGTVSASARAMLSAGAFTYWLQGDVATSVIIADHSAGRAFDLGFDTDRPFRPIFHATFFPGAGKVRVRFIGEIANTQGFEDLVYALALQVGSSSATVYSQPTFTHHAFARWTKEFWIGGAPPAVDTDHGLTYLSATTLLPNYDTDKNVPESTIASEYAAWTNAPKALFAAGNWTKAMGATGGRRDIGMYPAWTVRWLYTGDRRMREMAFGNADLAGAWGVHVREGDPGRHFLRGSTDGAAVGRVVSVTARPSLFTRGLTDGNSGSDKLTLTGDWAATEWSADGAHQPDPYSPLYLLTGDFWYLEQSWFWAAWGTVSTNPGDVSYGRGPAGAAYPSGSYGHISDQLRGEAWLLRNRAAAASISPDDAPEKEYFTVLLNDCLEAWEGMRNIPSPNASSAMWVWGLSQMRWKFAPVGVPSPLRIFADSSAAFVQGLDATKVRTAVSPWEQNMLIMVLGRVKELGYRSDALLRWVAPVLISQLTTPGYTPERVSAYRLPALKEPDGQYFATWPQVATGFFASDDPASYFAMNNNDPEHGYTYIALAATSYLTNEPGGAAAWAFMQSRVLSSDLLDANPKWAIIPRTSDGALRAPSNLRAR